MKNRVINHPWDLEKNRSGHNTFHPQLSEFDLITARNTAANTGTNPSAQIMNRRNSNCFSHHTRDDFADRPDPNTLLQLELAQNSGRRQENRHSCIEPAREAATYAQQYVHFQPDMQSEAVGQKQHHPLQAPPDIHYQPPIQYQPSTQYQQQPAAQYQQPHQYTSHSQNQLSVQYQTPLPQQPPILYHQPLQQPLPMFPQSPFQYQHPLQSYRPIPFNHHNHHLHLNHFVQRPTPRQRPSHPLTPLGQREEYNAAVGRSYAKQKESQRWQQEKRFSGQGASRAGNTNR